MSEEEMKALVEMNNMLKHENEKLKQDKQELIEWLEDEMKALNPKKLAIGELNLRLNDIEFFSYFQLKQILEKLGE